VIVAAETKVNVQKLKDVGTLIGYIVDEHKAAITDLSKVDPNAGKFDAAEWLEDLFVDRRDAIKTHMDNLSRAFTEINEGLVAIAKEFEGVDATNADAVAKFTASAKGIIAGMGKAEYDPKMSQSKTSYETGDDKKMNDLDSFDFKDPKNPKILEFDPSKVPGMDVTAEGLGKDNNKTIDFGEQKDLKGDHSIEIGAGPAEQKPEENKPEENKPEETKPQPTELKELKDPKDSDEGKDGEKDADGKTYRYYLDDTGHHQKHNGNEIWWTNGKPYVGTNGHFIEYHVGNDAPPTELKQLNEKDEGKDGEATAQNKTYRYYNDDSGQQQTHNGNKIWWYDGKTYLKYSNGNYVTFIEYHAK
jgi:hypothetical protein